MQGQSVVVRADENKVEQISAYIVVGVGRCAHETRTCVAN